MKYYKIIQDKTFIGAVASDNFIKYQPALQCFLRSDEIAGEYVDFNCILYRDTWMKPITEQREFIQASIIAISEEEYNVYMEAMQNNEVIEDETEDEEPTPITPDVNPNDEASLRFIKESKINEMSYRCRQTIEEGFDLQLTDGQTHHFSLTTQD